MKTKTLALSAAISAATLGMSSTALANEFTEALTGGKAKGDIRLRYESVDNDVTDSDGLTIRTRLGYQTGEISGFSAYVEFEDVSDVAGVDDEDGLIPDPEVTEIDQSYIQYKNDMVTAKLGRQVITLDGHRHVGHVGWRQDRQTFDALRVSLKPAEKMTLDLIHINRRNRIFGEAADAQSDDYLINASYATPIGKLVGYGYLLDDEARNEQSDTFGFSFTGKTGGDVKFLYAAEFATQEITVGEAEFDTEYTFLEAGVAVSGVTVKLGYEVLGSDDGMASFTTPLATLHKFNGWGDIFLGGTFNPVAMPNGLEDLYVSVGGKVAGTKLAAIYHDFSANEGSTDYGSELDLVAAKKFGKHYNAGVKYSMYSDDGFTGAAGDIDKLWVWVGASF